MEKIKIAVMEPMRAPEVREIPHDLEEMQAVVGGRLDRAFLLDVLGVPIDLVFDDEFLLEGKPWNVAVPSAGVHLGGTVFFVRVVQRTGDWVSLTDEDIAAIQEALRDGRIRRLMSAARNS